jgi:hypothetical protein
MAEKRTPDAFQLARQIYNARTRHFDKAAELLRNAPPEVQALVKAHEDIDAQSTLPADSEAAAQ